MQKIIRFIATLSILGGLLAIRPLLALAIEPGPYPVAVGTSCWNLNEDIKFDNINSNWGFKITGNFNRTFTLTAANGVVTGELGFGQPEDPFNSATVSSANNLLNWSSTLGMDAVIVHGIDASNTESAYAFVYVPEAAGAGGLSVPPSGSPLATITSVEFCFDYELTGTKTANATWQKTIDWTIAKTAQQAPASAFAGQTANVDYSVELTKTETPVAGSYKVSGTITVKNQTPFNVGTAQVSDSVGGTAATLDCDPVTAGNQNFVVLLPGATKSCAYSATLANKVDGTNTATLTNLDLPNSYVGNGSATAPYAFGAATLAPGSEPETISVNDTLKGALGSFSSGTTLNYTYSETCPTSQTAYNAGVFSKSLNNTASINETTGDSSSASATVNCYAPVVSKTAVPSYEEDYQWSISKSPASQAYALFAGQGATHTYTIDVTRTKYDRLNFAVAGVITVVNPAPLQMQVALSDAVGATGGVITAEADCVYSAGILTIPASSTATCPYSVDMGDALDGQLATTFTNTATARLGNIDFTGSANFSFGAATPGLATGSEPASVTVTDDNATPGTADDLFFGPFTNNGSANYNRDLPCPTDPGNYPNGVYSKSYLNTATIDNTTGDSAGASVTLNCYAPLVSKTAAGSYDERHDWTVAKSVSLAAQDAFAGASAAYQWTVQVNETVREENFAVAGQILVTNPHPTAAMVVGLADKLNDAASTPGLIASGATCNYSAGVLTIPAGGTATCGYAAAPTGRTATSNTASALLNGLTASASAGVAWAPKVIHPTVTLSDNQATTPPWPATLSDGGSWSYNDSHTCSANLIDYTAGKYTFNESNTATLKDSGLTLADSTANVAVNCYAPLISKTAAGSYDERHEWALTKNAAPDNKDAFAGATSNFTWTVVVSETVIEEKFSAGGLITVANPAPLLMSVSLSDALSDATAATITPGASCAYANGALSIPANSTASCTYTAAPGGRTATLNTATATLNGASFTASAPLSWTANVTNASVVLEDGLNPAGAVTLSDGGIFSYPGSHTCSASLAAYTAGKYTFTQSNTAALKTLAGAPLASATDTINVNCYAPLMSKTASGSFGETHTWSLSKSASPAAQKAFAGDTANYTWTVTANDQVTAQGFTVTGSLVVTNPAPQAMSLDLTDTLSDGTPVVIHAGPDCSFANGKLTVASNKQATCALSATPTSQAASNTATALLNGATFIASADITWTAQVVNASVVLDDDLNPAFPQTINAGSTFSYAGSYTCSTDPAAYTNGVYTNTANNTATLRTLAGGLLTSTSASADVTCYAPVVGKSAKAETSSSLNWTIEKSVTPTAASQFAGGSVDFNYTVTLTKNATSGLNVVSGVITVTNPAGSPGVMDVSVSDTLSPAGLGDIAAAVDCGGGLATLSVAPGAKGICNYRAELPSATNGTNTATVRFNSHDYTASVPYTFVTVAGNSEPASVTVSDTLQGNLGTFSDNAVIPYTRPASCPADPAAYTNGVYSVTFNNTASINETPDQASASATLTCYAPLVSKDAQTEWFRSVDWTIAKDVTPASADAFAGGSATFDYTVTLTKTAREYGYRAFGTISVKNPHPSASMTVAVADAMGGTTATVDCGGGATSLTVAAGATGSCSYSLSLPDATGGTNTATVTLDGNPFTAQAAVIFGAPLQQGEPESVTVGDTFKGGLGTFSNSGTANYSRSESCSTLPGDYSNGFYSTILANTASINETQGDGDSASATLRCYAPLLSKTASGSYDEVHTWSVSKSVAPAAQKAFAGDSASYTWTVDVSEQVAEKNILAGGLIAVKNPAPVAMSLSLSDTLSDGTPATITASATCDYAAGVLTIPAGSTASCAYSASPSGHTAASNTATATLNGVSFSASADITWTANVSDASVTLDDDLGPNFPVVLTGGGTFTYPGQHTCAVEAKAYTNGVYTFNESNTARLTTSGGPLTSTASAAVTCYAPLVSKTADALTSSALNWVIEKSVTPTAASQFAGGSVDYNYTVKLTRDETSGRNEVSGVITVANPAGSPGAMNVTVSDLVAGTPAVVDCGAGTGDLSVDPGKSGTCAYRVELASATDGVNTATVRFNGHDYSASAPYTFVVGQGNSEPATVSVVDSLQGDLGEFSASRSVAYTRTQTCPLDPAAYTNGVYSVTFNNTARINETDDLASASASLTCYAPLVSKTAETAYTRTYDWTIRKGPDGAYDLFAGQGASHTYQVAVARGVSESGFAVSGLITVNNPNPSAAMTVSLADAVAGMPATLDCGGSLTVPAGGSATCGYSASLAEKANGTNTATATLNDIPFSASQGYAFGEPTQVLGSPTVLVKDSLQGDLGQVSDSFTWEYARPFTCPADPALYKGGKYSFSEANKAIVMTIDLTPIAAASGFVDVNCYAPQVSSALSTAFTRTYDWTITKGPNESYELFAGQSVEHQYQVAVDPLLVDDAWRVEGTIFILNNHPSSAMLLDDVLDDAGGITALVTCPALSIPPGGSLTCTFDTGPQPSPDPFGATNTATALFAGASWTDSKAISFGEPTSEINAVIHVDDDNLTGETWSAERLKAAWNYKLPFACSSDPADYKDGRYSFSHANKATILETGQSASATVDVTCLFPTSPVRVVKQIEQGSQDIGQFPIAFALYPSGAKDPIETIQLNAADVSGDGSYMLEFATRPLPGTWTVKELLPAGWASEGLVCTFDVKFDPNIKAYTCNFSNRELSRVSVFKTADQQVDPKREFTFAIFANAQQGAGAAFLSDPTLATATTLGDADGVLAFAYDLDPALSYTLCELPASSGSWISLWSLGGAPLATYDPGQYEASPWLTGYRCADLGAATAAPLESGEALAFSVDNRPADATAKGAGFWKNSASCSRSSSSLAPSPKQSFFTLDELLSRYYFSIGTLELSGGDCLPAVSILDQRDAGTGAKMASDGAYWLASHLFSYRLNQAAGICPSPSAAAAADAAQALLHKLSFNGKGAYLKKGADFNQAMLLSSELEHYNNGLSCGK